MSCLFGLAALSAFAAMGSASDLVNLWYQVDGWTMAAIAEADLTTHIIATRDDDETLTTDIDVVLYEKTVDGWIGSAYDPSITKEDALIDLATEFGLPDPQEGEWLIDFDQDDVLDYILPRAAFGKGFFVTDPLFEIATQLEDSEPLATAAEDAGLAAGSSVVNTGSISGGTGIGDPQPTDDDCLAVFYDDYAALVDLHLSDPTLTVDELYATVEALGGFLCPCWSSITITGAASTWSAWACSAWGTGTNNNNGTCTFTTTSSQIRSRTMTKTCHSCFTGNTLFTWTQFQSRFGTVSVVAPTNADGTWSQPTTCPAPGAGATTTTRWTPPGPRCPFA